MGSIQQPGQSGLPMPNSTKSFWHSQPSKILLGHRTTPEIPVAADIVIIGSGITGASAAHFIGQDEVGKKKKVVMLEAREACWGATGRNGGHCQPGIYDRPPELSSFEMRNYLALKDLVAKNNIDCDWVDLSTVHGYMSKASFNNALAEYANHLKTEPKIAKMITVVTKNSTNVSLADLRVSNAYGAIIQKHASSLWPYKLVCWILESLLAKNDPIDPFLDLQTNTPVTSLQKSNEAWLVHTPRGTITTKQVLLATNAYTSHLIPGLSSIIVPVRGEMSALIPPPTMRPGAEDPPLAYSYGFMGNANQEGHQDDYLVQQPFTSSGTGGGELMFGGGRSCAANAGLGVWDDSSIDPPAAKYLRTEISNVLDLHNGGEELEATYEWSGIMGFSRDDRPLVGELTEDLGIGGGKGMWLCAAYTGHGMPNAFLSAKAVVEMMLGKRVVASVVGEGVDLPSTHRISKERVERARKMGDVFVADGRGGNAFP